MTSPLLPMALSLALTVGGAAPAASPAAGAPHDWDKPPPGSRADQALWQTAHDVNAELVIEQHAAARLAQGARASGYQERLPELARSGALPKARTDELQARLLKAWVASVELGQSQWPVSRTRVCQYELLNFESLMAVERASESQATDTRRTLTECIGRATSVLGQLKRSNTEFQAVLDEVGRELASLPATAVTTAPAAKAPPTSAVTTPQAPSAPAKPD